MRRHWPPLTYATIVLVALAIAAAVTPAAAMDNAEQVEEEPLTWTIANTEDGCQNPDEATRNQTTVVRNQVLCIDNVPRGEQINTEPLGFVYESSTGALSFPAASVTWNEASLSGFAVEFFVNDSPTRSEVTVLPDVRLDIEWLKEPQSSEDGDPDQLESEPQPAEPVIDESGVTKRLVIDGSDAASLFDIGDVVVHEQVIPGLFEARVAGVVQPVSENQEVAIEIPQEGSNAYQLNLAPGANRGQVETNQRSFVTVGDVRVFAAERDLIVASPSIEVTVQSVGSVRPGQSTEVTVRLKNLADTEFDVPLELMLSAKDGGQVGSFSDPSDSGSVQGSTVTWQLDNGLDKQGAARAATITIDQSAAGTTVLWEATLSRSGSQEPLARGEIPTDVGEAVPTGEQSIVDFDPAQLIQLIAFVVAFAILAIIYGAWSRSRRSRSNDANTEEFRSHELDLFRSYSEAILVLVIVVVVLVLTLRGSLEGESAASLIGVIAGYALGQGLKK